jgi:hypothetical protein
MDMPFSYENYLSSRQGASVILTLDTTVQACLEKQMQNAIDRYQVKNGAFGLVMHAKTGEILAMATLGSYDPNNYREIYDATTATQLEKLPAEKRAALLGVLAQDPRPAYQEDPARIYGFGFAGFEIKFTVAGDTLTVQEILPRQPDKPV